MKWAGWIWKKIHFDRNAERSVYWDKKQKDGDFLSGYPSDGHRTAVQVQEPETIKKAIFKVKI